MLELSMRTQTIIELGCKLVIAKYHAPKNCKFELSTQTLVSRRFTCGNTNADGGIKHKPRSPNKKLDAQQPWIAVQCIRNQRSFYVNMPYNEWVHFRRQGITLIMLICCQHVLRVYFYFFIDEFSFYEYFPA